MCRAHNRWVSKVISESALGALVHAAEFPSRSQCTCLHSRQLRLGMPLLPSHAATPSEAAQTLHRKCPGPRQWGRSASRRRWAAVRVSTAAACRLGCAHVPCPPAAQGRLGVSVPRGRRQEEAVWSADPACLCPEPVGRSVGAVDTHPPTSRTAFVSEDRALRRPTRGSCWRPRVRAGGPVSVGTSPSPRREQGHGRPAGSAGGQREGTCTSCFVFSGRGWRPPPCTSVRPVHRGHARCCGETEAACLSVWARTSR